MSEAEAASKTEKAPGRGVAAQDREIDMDTEDAKEGYGWGV